MVDIKVTDTYYIQFGRQFKYLNKEWKLELPANEYGDSYWSHFDTEDFVKQVLQEAVDKIMANMKELEEELVWEEEE